MQTSPASKPGGEPEPTMAEAKEWVPKLALPTGGGAIAGVGEKFEANAFTGSGSFSVPIVSSPGRGAPSLSLGYASGGGNGPFGVGWSVGTAAITRKTGKELPRYVDAVESDTFVLLGAEDLVPMLDSVGARVAHPRGNDTVYPYRPRVEGGFARIERYVDNTTGDTRWRVLTKDNGVSWFGRTAASRVSDPEDAARVFEWLLDESRDDLGSITEYEYKAELPTAVGSPLVAECNRSLTAGAYLKRIRYGNTTPYVAGGWRFEIVFDYGEHGTGDPGTENLVVTPAEDRVWEERSDSFSSFRSGFDIRTRRLCERVLMFHDFAELGATPTLVASTDFVYDNAEHMAKLTSVVQRAYERNAAGTGYIVADVPAVEFEYSAALVQPELGECDRLSMRNLPVGVGGEYRLIDLDGEGLPGIVTQQGDALYYKAPLGEGQYGAMSALATMPSTARLGAGAQLSDLDGDGRLEMVVREGTAGGYYTRTEEGSWDAYVAFEGIPTIDWNDPNLQQLDLNGDGFADVLISKDDHFIWYPSNGKLGYEAPLYVPKPTDEREGPALVFADGTGGIFIADMTGDGLSDIVRITHGSVYYWPNLGHGRFGRRVCMDAPPTFASADAFSPGNLRLGDIDSSGTTDIVYLDAHGARVWFNHSGNGFSAETKLRLFPGLSGAVAVEVSDLLGKGTACLVWSTEGAGGDTARVLYLDLMASKPHLLTSVVNNMGMETRLRYEPSTVQYLRDKAAGRPWITTLPFPAYVVTRVEHYDAVARRRAVQRFAYHHGYFDGVEREFRGFALVERWDTEGYDDFNEAGLFSLDLFDTIEENLHQPPVYTKTWFHTGAFMGQSRISRQLEDEYWDGDALSDAWSLPDTVLSGELTGAEAVEACRVLRGSTLRSEVYALDGSAEEGLPYSVAEKNMAVVKVQDMGPNKHAVFLGHEREGLALAYERDASNPRVSHSLVLRVGDYGDVEVSASVVYPARTVLAGVPEQGDSAVFVSVASFCAVDDVVAAPDVYRASVGYEQRGYEVHGVAVTASAPVAFATLELAVATAAVVGYEVAVPTDRLRLLSASRSYFYSDDLSSMLALGQCGTRALPYESRGAAMTTGQVSSVFSASEVDNALMLGDGGYLLEEEMWWTRSGRQVMDPLAFYRPTVGIDPFGNQTRITYDTHGLFVETVVDPLGNEVEAEYDYRVLSPFRMTDPNGHRSEVGFDTRGMTVWSALMGRAGGGDTPADPTTVLEYDVFAWRDRGEPNVSHARVRETHADVNTRWLHTYTYADGAGNVLLSKATAEPGLAPQRDATGALVLVGGEVVLVEATSRWVGSGRTVFDNKGNPVRQYEPYFSSMEGYEDETELRERGVSPLMHYDPLGRLLQTDFPDGTSAAVTFTPWMQTTWDRNDRVSGSAWELERQPLPANDPARQALERTLEHNDTPSVVHLDAMGRTVLGVVENVVNGVSEFYETRTVMDVQGNALEVIDARGNTAEGRVFGMGATGAGYAENA